MLFVKKCSFSNYWKNTVNIKITLFKEAFESEQIFPYSVALEIKTTSSCYFYIIYFKTSHVTFFNVVGFFKEYI